ncbi:restriction endonuclease subunit S [Dehalococcoides mccartyi]|uniref:Restriction endonuclease S subunit n=1 Tax=Dehalococcoides mccartyi TaxID=61435 RepID=A0A142V840_9CHLR|nr:restriction endonuclease subunit S [Dehalococcoides mccartyi]AMU85996.1 restriction endonuclease S subunit [Dehalococcoides mccartyi]
MEIKTGYKQTEIGVIPENWKIKPLKELCVPNGLVRGPFGGSLKKEYFVDSGIKVYEQKNAIEKNAVIGSYFVDNSKFSELKRFEVFEKDFIVSCSGTIGRIFQIPHGAPKGIINQALLKIKTNEEVVNEKYFLLYFEWEKFQERIIDNTQGGAMKNLVGMSIFKNTSIALPSTLSEQNAIAEALSGADNLITSLEKLIAKKKDIKQGAMQLLLTGKKRLPGFSGEWEIKTIGDLFSISGGLSASRDKLSDDGYCYLHYGDIHGSNKSYIDVGEEYPKIPKLQVNIKSVTPKSLLNDGDVVFVDASEDDEGASKHIVIKNQNNIPYISGLHTIVLKSKDNSLVNLYKQYCFKTNAVKKQFKFFAVGTKVTGISKTNISNVQLLLPPTKGEQSLIAQALSDMDNEIEELESKLSKYRLIKQGMMQELLTGKKRLV